MAKARSIRWLDDAEAKDYLAAHSFLSMMLEPSVLEETVAALRTAPLGHWAAKDVLRATGLPALRAKQSTEVEEKLAEIKGGVPISPVLLIGGIREFLVVADGYHRVSAAHRDEGALVPGRLLWQERGRRPA